MYIAIAVIAIIIFSIANVVKSEIEYRSEMRRLEEEREKRIRQLQQLKMFGIDASSIIDQMKK